MSSVNVDDLAEEINKELSQYNSEVIEGVKKAVDEVAEECNEEIKNHITFQRHKGDKYVKSFAMKTTKETKLNKTKTWYVKAPYYRLTHLLENGHATRNGGSTKAYPHIQYGEELAQRNLPEKIEEVINGVGKY